MDCSLPGSSVHGILQARILEGVAVSFSRGFSQPGDQTCISCVSCIVGRFFPIEPLGKTLTTICIYFEWSLNWSDFACKQLCSRSFCRGSVSIYFSVFEEACLLPFFLKNIVTSEVGHCLCSPSLELSRFCHHDWRQEFHFLSECLKSFFFNVKVEYNQVVSCCFAFWTKISWHFNLGIPFFSISWKFSFLWICILFPLLWSCPYAFPLWGVFPTKCLSTPSCRTVAFMDRNWRQQLPTLLKTSTVSPNFFDPWMTRSSISLTQETLASWERCPYLLFQNYLGI